jgi:transposase-like protein
MADISYAALPKDQKIQIARALRPSHTVRELAPMFGVGTKAIFNWTKGIASSLDQRKRRRPPIKPADPCTCTQAATDREFDAYCLRSAHCLYCGKPRS